MIDFYSKNCISIGNQVIWLAGMEHVHGLFEAEQKIKWVAPPRCDHPYGAVRAGSWEPADKGRPQQCRNKGQGREQ